MLDKIGNFAIELKRRGHIQEACIVAQAVPAFWRRNFDYGERNQRLYPKEQKLQRQRKRKRKRPEKPKATNMGDRYIPNVVDMRDFTRMMHDRQPADLEPAQHGENVAI